MPLKRQLINIAIKEHLLGYSNSPSGEVMGYADKELGLGYYGGLFYTIVHLPTGKSIMVVRTKQQAIDYIKDLESKPIKWTKKKFSLTEQKEIDIIRDELSLTYGI